jgi:hypothetical protein
MRRLVTLPMKPETPKAAEDEATRFKIRSSSVRATVKGGRMTSLDVSEPSVDIRTSYGKGVDPEAPSTYGRGTTDEDVANSIAPDGLAVGGNVDRKDNFRLALRAGRQSL